MNAVTWAQLGVAIIGVLIIPAGALLVNMRTTLIRQGDRIDRMDSDLATFILKAEAWMTDADRLMTTMQTQIDERTVKHGR